MKTQNHKLAFNKCSVTELNDAQLLDIDGGTTPVCVAATLSSAGCAAGAGVVVGAALAYFLA